MGLYAYIFYIIPLNIYILYIKFNTILFNTITTYYVSLVII